MVAGQASFSSAGSALTVTNSPNAIINWQGFSIGTGEITRFVQQSAQSAVLNRVVGQDPSAILGTLSSNGKVFLINPNGILFGQGSRVDVAGLVASTLNLSNADFLQGRLNFEAGTTAGSLINRGDIVTGSGGRVLLLAPDVQNHGLISAPNGEVVLAAGKSVQLVEADLPQLKVEVASGGEALNVGSILSEGGKIGVYAGLINQRGVVRADSVTKDATGRIVFKSSDTTLLEDGSVTSASGAKGGEIQVLGNKVGLTGSAQVDASGNAGGGTVLIGGDFQGKNPEVQNAYRTYVGPDATIKADANVAGDGGKVIVWSDDATRAYGTISARGGAQSGNGGLVETSGHYLDVARAADVGASNGKGGTWLLDPWNITISSAADQNSSNLSTAPTYDFRASASPSVVSVSTITTALAAGGNVTVRTSGSGTEQGNITVSSPIATTQTTYASLSLQADNDIVATSDILLGSNVDLYLYAANSISTAALGGRYVSANASNGSISTGAITGGSSGVYLTAPGAIQPGAIVSAGSVQLSSSNGAVTIPSISSTSGSVYVYSYDDLALTSTLTTPYYTQIEVRKPGGLLTMASGSSITTGNGYSVQLRADDMALGGTINAGTSGSVTLDPYNYGRNIQVGSSTAAGALNLSPTEFATITAGTLSIGNYSSNYGDLTVSGALTASDVKASNLNLYGRSITAGDIGVSGNLYLYGYGGDITTGALNAASVNIDGNYGGITTGSIAATSSVDLYAYGPVRAGTITAAGSVSLNSDYGSVTVPAITTTGGSIYVYSYDDLTLSAALVAPSYAYVDVRKPGGLFTMASGSSIASANVRLRADDMALGGTINAGTSGSVYLDPYSYGRNIQIGSGTVAGALNLSPTEFATITAGTLYIGNYYSNYSDLAVSGALTASDVKAPNLNLYGRSITTGDIGVSGNLYLYGYGGDITTGALNAASVNIDGYYNSNGGITTGAITATSSVDLYAYGPVRPGTISAGGGVNLHSEYAGVTVPAITTTSGSVSIYSREDVVLGTGLSGTGSTTIEVRRPGGLLTQTSASTITAGGSVSLVADDMSLAGRISASAGSGTVYLNPYSYGRDIHLGSGDTADALNLSLTELTTLTAGSATIGSNRHSNGGTVIVSDPIGPGAAAIPANLYLYGANVALGAGITVTGSLGINGYYNIDGNTTAGDLSLTGSSIGLTASAGRIFRSGAGLTNINGIPNPGSSSTGYTLSAALGADLPGTVTATDQSYTVSSGDLTLGVASPTSPNQLGVVTGKNVTISVPNGAIVDGNGSGNNIIATTLNISAGNGIGSADAIETSVATLTASSAGTGNIWITNIGNLNASVTHTGSGALTLTNNGHLDIAALSVPSGNITLDARGRLNAPVAITTTGAFNANAYGNVALGNLAANGINIDASSGRLITGTLTSAASVYLSAPNTWQAGAISAAGSVNVYALNGGLTLAGVTSTAGSVNAYAFESTTLNGAIAAANGVSVEVRRPGGTLNMPSGSSIATGNGYSVQLRADDMALGGTINAGTSGYVYLDPYNYGRNIQIGSGTVAGALNLAPAELATITAGTLTIGNYSSSYGDLTVAGALTASDVKAPNLYLYGRSITAGDIGVSGNLYLYGYGGDITTGALNAASVNIDGYYNSSGGITTGAITATSYVDLYAYGPVRPGTINAGSSVTLRSEYAGVTVPTITTTGGSINVVSYDDVTLASTVSSNFGTALEVRKPGGLLTMASGASITTGNGAAVNLRADDMALGGTINAGTSGYVYLDPHNYGRNIQIGSGTVAGALNLSPTEFATITAGTLSIGDYSSNYGDLTVSGALTASDVKASNLNLYGRSITAGDIGVSGNLYLYGYGGDITTGALNAASVNIDGNYGGITTGSIAATSSVDLYAYGPVRPGTITAAGNVNLNSNYGSVTVPAITTTGGSIYVYSYDDMTLTGTLSAPYYTQIEVQRPGGVLTMAPGSSITGTSTSGYSVRLDADEMVLGGSVSTSGSGYVYLNPQSYGRDVHIGTGSVAGALNLTPAELSTISTGTLYIGNNYGQGYYGGNLTVGSPIVSTDIRATTLNLYGNSVSLSAGIAVSGNLGIYAVGNIDANTTASAIDLFATGNIDLESSNGRIYRTGTGVTNVTGATTNFYAPLGVDLGGTTSGGDVSVTWDQGDYALSTLTATNLTLNVTNGGIVDTNGTALNITAGSVTLNAANGIGDGKAIDTAITTLTATTGGTGSIQINNTGNLTVTSVTNTGTGNIALTNAGSLTIGTASTAGGSFTANATGALSLSGNISGAPTVQLTSGGAISQSGGAIGTSALPAALTTSSVGGTSLTGSNYISSFAATNSGAGNIALSSLAPLLTITGITQSGGGGVTLLANDLSLNGPINAGAGLVSIAPVSSATDMFVGEVSGSGLQLSSAEILQIDSTNIQFGRSDGTGNLNIALTPTAIIGGSLTFLAGGSVNVSGGPYTLQGGTANLPGTTNVASGTSIVVESGLLNASGGTVNLNGTMQTTGGAVTAGIVNVGGTLNASGGSLSAGALNVLSGGLLMGTGTVTANVTNSGKVSPGASPGQLRIIGNYVQTSTGILEMEIAGPVAGAQYDQLVVDGSVVLDGTLTTVLSYLPASTDQFDLIVSNSNSVTLVPTFVPVIPGLAVPPPGTAPSFTVSTERTQLPSTDASRTVDNSTSQILNQTDTFNSLTSQIEELQQLVTEPTGATQEENGLAKKKPACS